MMKVRTDENAYLQLPPTLRAKYGETFLLLKGRGELILRAIPRDTLQDFREIGQL